jgi:ribose 5-phosphate isomerase RpiB
MIYTARQLEDLHRASGHVTVPYGARLTPLALDWVKSKKLVIAYGGEAGDSPKADLNHPAGSSRREAGATTAGVRFVWWCDGPCGHAKSAISELGHATRIDGIEISSEPVRLVEAIKSIAAEVGAGRAAGGILLVKSGAAAAVYANRCRSLRAIVATGLESVEEGLSSVAANVLIIEYTRQTLMQVRNLAARFLRGQRAGEAPAELQRQLTELQSCG